MKIKCIKANNFRTLENFSVNLNQHYCTISGKNNAGKSGIISIIEFFLEDERDVFFPSRRKLSFQNDATQWADRDDIEISINIEVTKSDDSEMYLFIEKFTGLPANDDIFIISLTSVTQKDESSTITCNINGTALEPKIASEILKKLRSTPNLIMHNSTAPNGMYYYFGDSYTEIFDGHFSAADKKSIADAEKALQVKIRKAAKQHKQELEDLLGRLNEKYQVELGIVDRSRASHLRLEIKLTDRSAEVPLNYWGSGTQNRTRILMSALQAIRIRSSATEEDRTTPIFLVEEPESFLHPSAQAEFGQILNDLAEELNIQIIATTHSPYMLNQRSPDANILLERRLFRGLPKETYVKETCGSDWMLPFSETLGVIPREFDSWKTLFKIKAGKIILVEGDIDKQYFKFLLDTYPSAFSLPSDVEIVSYDGKSALQNTSILQFMIQKFGRVFITFDLDAKLELKPCLERIGLVDGSHFLAIGRAEPPGHDCIEGLIPSEIKKQVFSENHEIVTALMSGESKIKNNAKSKLKKLILEKCLTHPPKEKDLSHFKSIFSAIKKAFQ